jgi:hypothetical protein
MTGDAFTRDKLVWLEAISEDQNVTGSAMKVATKIALRYLSRTKGCAWPSFDKLAHDLGAGRSSIIRALSLLEGLGWLVIEHNGGRHATNRYALQMQKQCHPWHENSVIRDKETVSSLTPEPFEGNPLKEPNEVTALINQRLESGDSQQLSFKKPCISGTKAKERGQPGKEASGPMFADNYIEGVQQKVLEILPDDHDLSADATVLNLIKLVACCRHFRVDEFIEHVEDFSIGWEPATDYTDVYTFLQSEIPLFKNKRPAEVVEETSCE